VTDAPRPPQAPGERPPAQQWPQPQPQPPAGAGDARAKAIELVDGEWHRLHPATPLLRGGLALIIVLGIIVSTFRDRLIGIVVPEEWNEFEQDPFGDFIIDQLLWVALGTVGLVLLGILVFWLSWRVHRFRITGDAVEVQQGILVKRHRRAPLARIQAINIQKPWFARLLGACKFEVQQAGNDANVDLNYLSSSVADALRYEVMDRASGRSAADAQRMATERAGTAGGVVNEFLRPDAEIAHLAPHSLVRIPLGRIVASSLLDGWIVWAVAYAIGTLVLIIGFQQFWAVFALLPGAIAFFAAGMRSLGSKLRYSIAATPDGIRLAYGLASTTTEILPPGRIFALQVKQPLLWRPFGWWQVTFTRAGKSKPDGSGQGGQSSQMASYLLPVGDLRDVRTVVGLVLPELAQSPLVDAGLFGQAPDAFVVSPPRARAFRWFSVRRNGFHVHDAAFLLRTGRIWRSLQLVPQARVQSVALQQGPIYGLARLGRVQFHVPDTVLSPGIGAIDQGDARILFDHAMRTVKVAIDRDTSESWAASLSRNAVLETAPAVQDGLMSPPSPPVATPWQQVQQQPWPSPPRQQPWQQQPPQQQPAWQQPQHSQERPPRVPQQWAPSGPPAAPGQQWTQQRPPGQHAAPPQPWPAQPQSSPQSQPPQPWQQPRPPQQPQPQSQPAPPASAPQPPAQPSQQHPDPRWQRPRDES